MFWKVWMIVCAVGFVVGIIAIESGIFLSVMLDGSWLGAVLLLLGMVDCTGALLLGSVCLWKIFQEKEAHKVLCPAKA